ncbi:flagellar motor protein MotD [Methylobacillus caricis]|uniref:flagellar motor protein MotD n=1 Tax=Methylobacillus caricis TaxID=1971611 RepID=UPI001CFF9898|nr:flagellar motor protein MotD [Methylobacillus caricis]MCB5187981.1 flagellar motor protein MotD [Methylobacillus caricis]
MGRRRKFEEEPENHDRWLVSYADFITLLFAFFVVMYGISSVNEGKYKELTSALGTAFSGTSSTNGTSIEQPTDNDSKGPADQVSSQTSLIRLLPLARLQKDKLRREQEAISAIASRLSRSLATLARSGKINITTNDRGVRIDIYDNLLFTPGSSEIKQDAVAPINDIAQVLLQTNYDIQVEGHTDNVPIQNSQYPSNWELSATRASSVVRQMIKEGITDTRLSAVGYSDTQAIADNTTEEGRAKNRRVSIMVLYKPLTTKEKVDSLNNNAVSEKLP